MASVALALLKPISVGVDVDADAESGSVALDPQYCSPILVLHCEDCLFCCVRNWAQNRLSKDSVCCSYAAVLN